VIFLTNLLLQIGFDLLQLLAGLRNFVIGRHIFLSNPLVLSLSLKPCLLRLGSFDSCLHVLNGPLHLSDLRLDSLCLFPVFLVDDLEVLLCPLPQPLSVPQ